MNDAPMFKLPTWLRVAMTIPVFIVGCLFCGLIFQDADWQEVAVVIVVIIAFVLFFCAWVRSGAE